MNWNLISNYIRYNVKYFVYLITISNILNKHSHCKNPEQLQFARKEFWFLLTHRLENEGFCAERMVSHSICTQQTQILQKIQDEH